MYLMIDMSQKDIVGVALFDENSIKHKKEMTKNRDLLPLIEKFAEEEGIKKEDIHGVMAVVGSGSFTSTRIGCVIANAFAFAMKIPAMTITKEESANPSALIPKLLKQTRGAYVSAKYSGEPNIGK